MKAKIQLRIGMISSMVIIVLCVLSRVLSKPHYWQLERDVALFTILVLLAAYVFALIRKKVIYALIVFGMFFAVLLIPLTLSVFWIYLPHWLSLIFGDDSGVAVHYLWGLGYLPLDLVGCLGFDLAAFPFHVVLFFAVVSYALATVVLWIGIRGLKQIIEVEKRRAKQ